MQKYFKNTLVELLQAANHVRDDFARYMPTRRSIRDLELARAAVVEAVRTTPVDPAEPGQLSILNRLAVAAASVCAAWRSGDLAEAVRRLDAVRTEAEAALADPPRYAKDEEDLAVDRMLADLAADPTAGPPPPLPLVEPGRLEPCQLPPNHPDGPQSAVGQLTDVLGCSVGEALCIMARYGPMKGDEAYYRACDKCGALVHGSRWHPCDKCGCLEGRHIAVAWAEQRAELIALREWWAGRSIAVADVHLIDDSNEFLDRIEDFRADPSKPLDLIEQRELAEWWAGRSIAVTDLDAENTRLGVKLAETLHCLRAFDDYYTQAGIGDADADADDQQCDADECFNVRQARVAIAKAEAIRP